MRRVGTGQTRRPNPNPYRTRETKFKGQETDSDLNLMRCLDGLPHGARG